MSFFTNPLFRLFALAGIISVSACAPKPLVPYVPTNLTVKSDKIIGDGVGQLRQKINAYRAKSGRQSLASDPKITLAARDHSTAMNTHNFFDHTGRKGEGFATRMLRRGYPISTSAENIAISADPARVFQMWLDSPGHHKNIMDKRFSRIGIARVGNYWTADFAAEPRR